MNIIKFFHLDYYIVCIRFWFVRHLVFPVKRLLVKSKILSADWIDDPNKLSTEEIIMGFDDHADYLSSKDKK